MFKSCAKALLGTVLHIAIVSAGGTALAEERPPNLPPETIVSAAPVKESEWAIEVRELPDEDLDDAIVTQGLNADCGDGGAGAGSIVPGDGGSGSGGPLYPGAGGMFGQKLMQFMPSPISSPSAGNQFPGSGPVGSGGMSGSAGEPAPAKTGGTAAVIGAIGAIGAIVQPVGDVVYGIVNIGQTIWNVVQQGKPTATEKYDIATALPKGTTCWVDLEGWNRPLTKLFEVKFKNKMGMTPVKMTYRIVYLAEGSVDGVGHYIGFATMQPVSVEVGWGYTFNAQATVPSVYNMGTRKDPIAAMQMNLIYTIDSTMSHSTESHQFLITGKGEVDLIRDTSVPLKP